MGSRGPRGARRKIGRPSTSEKLSVEAYWGTVFDSPEYRANILERIFAGKAQAVEGYFLSRVFGKPIEKHELTGSLSVGTTVIHEHLLPPGDAA